MEKEISPGWNGLDDKLFQSLYLIGRLKPGVTTQQATSSTNLLFQQILRSDYLGSNPSQEELNTIRHASIDLTSASHGLSSLRQRFSPPLKILMVIVGLVLLIACANIANMLLARGVVRAREIAVRMALGASRRRIILQLLTESAVLALAGATIGIALAWKAGPLLLRLATPGPNPVPLNLSPDLRVLGFALLITISTALLFGVIPALRATRLQLSPALKDGRGATAAPHRSRLQRSLIVGQIALSILLLTAASLFLRSLMNLTSINTGFDSKNVLVFSLDELAANLKADSNLVRLQQQIESRVKALPAVQADSFSMFTFDQGQWSDTISLPDSGSIAQTKQNVLFNVIGDDFFSTVGLPLQVGRPFSGHDTEATPAVAIINETMQRHFFPNQYAIGHHFGIGGEPSHGNDFEIIGVVKDAKYVNLGESQQMAAYFPYSQRVQYFSNFAVRYTGDKTPVVTAVRQTLAEINPAILVRHVSTLEDQVNGSIATPRLIAQLSAFFGLVAVFLSSIGIYGLISYSVLRRTSEIGIRLALGARTTSLLWMVLREAALLLSIGILVGVPVALLSTRILRKLLYQLSPNDPWALVLAVVAVAAMALLAAWLPARRASRVDPIIALRCE
jgi:predicted permease